MPDGNINLVGPSAGTGAPQITPTIVNDAVNPALDTKASVTALNAEIVRAATVEATLLPKAGGTVTGPTTFNALVTMATTTINGPISGSPSASGAWTFGGATTFNEDVAITNGVSLVVKSGAFFRITDSPVSLLDVPNKGYVDTIAVGLTPLSAAAASSITNVNVASAPSTMDGYSLLANDRVLLMGQTSVPENGLWVFSAAASALTRPTDYANAAVLTQKPYVAVVNGSARKGNTYITTVASITVGTTSTVWVLFQPPLPSSFNVSGTIGAKTMNSDTFGGSTGTPLIPVFEDGGGSVQGVLALVPQFAYAWADSSGNIAGGIQPDGRFVFNSATVNNPILGSVPSLTIVADKLSPVSPLAPTIAYAITDAALNAAFTIDTSGNVDAATAVGRLSNLPIFAGLLNAPNQLYVKSKTYSNFYGHAQTSGRTWAMLWGLAGDFIAVRFVIPYGGKGACTVTGICAPTAAPNDGINPIDANGSPVAWTPITFNNAGSGDVDYWQQLHQISPPAAITSFTLMPVDAADTHHEPGEAGTDALGYSRAPRSFTDWIPIRSIARTDISGAPPLVMVRLYQTGLPRPANFLPTSTPTWFGNAPIMGFVNAGDCVTTPANFTSTTRTAQQCVGTVQYISIKRAITIMSIGDSFAQGVGADNDNRHFCTYACADLSTDDLPWEFCNGGQSAMDHDDCFYISQGVLAEYRPDIAVIQAGCRQTYGTSPPGIEYATPEYAFKVWTNALIMAQRCKELGIIPIFFSPWPDSEQTAGTDVNRMMVVQWANDAIASGALGFDANSIIGLPGTPWTINPLYQPGSGFGHVNNAGQSALYTQGLKPILKKIIGRV